MASGGKNTTIPRPVTKRQFSSPASCGVAHINLSDVVAKITGGPKSCTNPFRNGLLSHSSDESSPNHRIDFNETVNPYSGERYLYAQIIDEKSQKNPFLHHSQRSNDQPFFLFPSSENVNNVTSTTPNRDGGEYTEKSEILIELNEDDEEEAEAEHGKAVDGNGSKNVLADGNDENKKDVKLVQIETATSDTIDVANSLHHSNNSLNHNRSLSDTGSAISAADNVEQLTTNPFDSQHLHKTVSDTHLEKYSMQKSAQHPFERTPSRQSLDTSLSSEPANNPSPSLSVNESEMKRAMSCESINSESSVLMADLVPPQTVYPSVTGQLCVGMQPDK